MSKSDLKSRIDTMIKLLEDPKCLIGNATAQSAVQKLNEVIYAYIDRSKAY